jgi:glucosamine--fructose-6-phosphate aminotransferase (isomerizing)
MLKEIFEQPRSLEDTLRGRLDINELKVHLDTLKLSEDQIKKFRKMTIVACGTSYHAGLMARYLFESWVQAPCDVEIASEFRYRNPLIGPEDLLVAISQSGETADTIAAVRHAKEKGATTLAICNSVGSTLYRECHGKILTHCGPEIGVASTKAFTAQLAVLYVLALYGALLRGTLPRPDVEKIMRNLLHLPRWVGEALKTDAVVATLAKKYFHSRNFLFLGRNLNYPIALEGALKLKEISYIHAEGYPGRRTETWSHRLDRRRYARDCHRDPRARVRQGDDQLGRSVRPGGARDRLGDRRRHAHHRLDLGYRLDAGHPRIHGPRGQRGAAPTVGLPHRRPPRL